MAEWKRGEDVGEEEGTRCLVLVTVTVRGKAQAMTAVSSRSQAFTASQIIMSQVDLQKKRHFRKELKKKDKKQNWVYYWMAATFMFTCLPAHPLLFFAPWHLLYLLVKATQITAISKVHI